MNPTDIANIGTFEPPTPMTLSGEMQTPLTSGMVEGFQGEYGNAEGYGPADTFNRMAALQGAELLPQTASGISSWAVDAADPATFSFAVQAPRVQLKPKLGAAAYSLVRGDIGIQYYPEIPMVGRSQYDRDNWISGFFSPQNQVMWDRFTGAEYKNMPQYVSAQGTIMDT
jgi:hypothetical protein